MAFTIISYFTRNTFYEKDAEQLRLSCEKAGLDHQIDGIDSFGKWHEHVCYKPHFILQKLNELKRPLLWVDADAEVVQKPPPLPECDLSLRVFDHFPADHPSYLFAATIYCSYTPQTLALIETWGRLCQEGMEKNPGLEVSDQVFLKAALDQLSGQIRFHPLPAGFAALFDQDSLPPDQLYIVQYQASRLYRKFINQEIVSFGAFDSLSIQDLRNLRPKLH